MRPSCGMRRSAMSRSERIFDAGDDRGDRARRHGRGLLEHAVDAVADPHLLFLGLEVDVGRAALHRLGDDAVHELDDRRVLAGGAEVDRLVLADVVERRGGRGRGGRRGRIVGDLELFRGDGAVAEVRVLEALEQALDVREAGHRGAHLVARHHGDVVDREHVRGVDHGDDERAIAGEGHRDGLVAADGGGRDELGGVGIDAVEREVDVVEAEALGDGAAQLLVGERAVADQDALGGGAVRVPALDREVHRAAVDEAEVHDHVRQDTAGAAAPGGRGDAVAAPRPGCGFERGAHVAMSATASRIA